MHCNGGNGMPRNNNFLAARDLGLDAYGRSWKVSNALMLDQ